MDFSKKATQKLFKSLCLCLLQMPPQQENRGQGKCLKIVNKYKYIAGLAP